MVDVSKISENRECPILYLVVPCYNEEECIDSSAEKLKEKLNRLVTGNIVSNVSKIMFVNDGSRDNTLRKLHEIAHKDSVFSVVSLSGNSGHQNAILAGMTVSKEYADIVITIDADLQQDIEALDDFIKCYKNGCEVVYGVRNDRESDGFMKKVTALTYYKLMSLLGSDVIKNHADYRLMSKKALYALGEYEEGNLFLRGLIPSMKFPSDIVYFDVKKREFGESKYTISKMLHLALDGITSFSTKPIRLISGFGCVIVAFSVIMLLISIWEWAEGKNVPGYTTIVTVMLIMFGFVFISLGIIGEYIGKIYLEAKKRPHYIIDSIVHDCGENKSEE